MAEGLSTIRAAERRPRPGRLAKGVGLGAAVALAALVATMTTAGAAPGDGVVEPDGALFTPGVSYPPLGALNLPVVGWASGAPSGGAWEVAGDGGVFTRGTSFYGSAGNIRLNQPIVGMTATPDGHGYWLVAADGGIFSFGDAGFYGSAGSVRLNQPIVAMTATPDGGGYWLVAADGGIFSFGDAGFYGSSGSVRLNQPIVGMTATADGHGYWLVAADGGIFSFGDAGFYGSAAGRGSGPAVSVAPAAGGGYDVTLAEGSVWQFGAGNPGTEIALLPIPVSYTADLARRKAAEEAVAVALAQVGKPYAYGGSGPGAFDCSGLTRYAYAAAGVALPHNAAEQFRAVPHVPLSSARPGDLLFFYPGITHVGIYLGNGLMVDSPHAGASVRVERLSAGWGPVMAVGRPG